MTFPSLQPSLIIIPKVGVLGVIITSPALPEDEVNDSYIIVQIRQKQQPTKGRSIKF